MNVFVETSAILAWLLKEDDLGRVASVLAVAESVVASELLLVEGERVLLRSVATGRLSASEADELRERLRTAAGHWTRLELTSQILERSKHGFPIEPVRSLDALHLATALEAKYFVPEIRVLSLDHRIRVNARSLGFEVLPVSASAAL
ncbi:MAG: type II toxin-antitoxin system VapC family toxin [Acidobacteria bacterium]|nr:type II toxin-antitoxin system VapC family toxin [Acidobacteriota bacterium]